MRRCVLILFRFDKRKARRVRRRNLVIYDAYDCESEEIGMLLIWHHINIAYFAPSNTPATINLLRNTYRDCIIDPIDHYCLLARHD